MKNHFISFLLYLVATLSSQSLFANDTDQSLFANDIDQSLFANDTDQNSFEGFLSMLSAGQQNIPKAWESLPLVVRVSIVYTSYFLLAAYTLAPFKGSLVAGMFSSLLISLNLEDSYTIGMALIGTPLSAIVYYCVYSFVYLPRIRARFIDSPTYYLRRIYDTSDRCLVCLDSFSFSTPAAFFGCAHAVVHQGECLRDYVSRFPLRCSTCLKIARRIAKKQND